MKKRSGAVQMKRGYGVSRKNSEDWVEIRDTPATAPPATPESAEQFWHEYWASQPPGTPAGKEAESWCWRMCHFAAAYAAHLQAELEQVRKDRDDWEAVADSFDGQLDRMRTRAEAAEARRRVLEEALANLLNVMQGSIGVGIRTTGQKGSIKQAERALAGQEEK